MERFPEPLANFPWATPGRPETESELLFKWRQQRSAAETFSHPVLFSILVVGGSDEKTLASLESQSYPHVEILTVTDIEHGVKAAKGKWIGIMQSGDVLSPAALFLVADEIDRHPDVRLIYANEKTADGRFYSKSHWSTFNLLHFDAIGWAWWIRKEDWAKDELSVFLKTVPANTRHLPFFLLYRHSGEALPAASEERRKKIEIHLASENVLADVSLQAGRLKIVPHGEAPKVTAIICFRDRPEWTSECVQHLSARAQGVDLEILLVDNESSLASRLAVEKALPRNARIIDYKHPFNFAAMNNEAAKVAHGELLLFLNNDVFWTQGNLSEMAAWARQEWVGTVGMCLRYPHGDIQHAGLRAFFGGAARLARLGHDVDEDELTLQSREVFGSSFAACLVSKKKFDAIGGLRPRDLPNGFGDVAFNFECRRRGWRNLFLGFLEGTHLESASRGSVYEYWEEILIEREYPEQLQAMVREDLGFNRLPGADLSLGNFVKDWSLVQVREKLPWLKPWKETVKKQLRELGLRGDNRVRNERRDSQPES